MADPVTGSTDPVHVFPDIPPRSRRTIAQTPAGWLIFLHKTMVFGSLQKSKGSKEPVSTRMFQSLEPVRILLQDPRILHDFREALGETQGYGCRPAFY